VKYGVFIQANDKQRIGALVADYALRRNSSNSGDFDVHIMYYQDYPFMHARDGEMYLRDGEKRNWISEDLQSFTPLRFMPPKLMNYQGRAVVTDPDVFALADVWELLSRDMQGKAILCRPKSGSKGKRGCMATSVMLLDCEKLKHWDVEHDFNQMFTFQRDYMDWVCLQYEDPDSIGLLEQEWNDFDNLASTTKMLHNTKRKTQPWKTGLPVDYRPADTFRLFPPKHWIRHARRSLFGDYKFVGKYKQHPDQNQENLFFSLLKECLDNGIISEQVVQEEMQKNHLRHDTFQQLEKVTTQSV
jgi:hypothetical protein